MTSSIVVSIALAVASAASDPKTEWVTPAISGHGKVVRLRDAPEQPRSGAKIFVDLTAGGPRDKLNAAVEKVARYVNIYAGAGRKPAAVRITVVLHGEATAVSLSDAAYGRRFKTRGNPNLPLIRTLKKAGVSFEDTPEGVRYRLP